MAHLPSDQEIQSRAYEIWEERGRPWGTPEIDWFEAEAELTVAQAESALSGVARDVGAALGTIVAFLTNSEVTRDSS